MKVSRNNIIWPTTGAPSVAVKAYQKYVQSSNTFGQLPAHMKTRLMREYKPLTAPQIEDIRRLTLYQKAYEGKPKLDRVASKITREYSDGKDILDISKEYDVPPLMTLRTIFTMNGHNKTLLYTIFNNSVDPEIYLRGRDLAQFRLAQSEDITGPTKQRQITKSAARAEEKFIAMVRKLGIKFQEQSELVAAQIKQFGRPVITPDILFNETVLINSSPVNWIDYKAFFFLPGNFIHKHILKQAAKYNDMFGPGAMCFQHGYPDNATIPGTSLIDIVSLEKYTA